MVKPLLSLLFCLLLLCVVGCQLSSGDLFEEEKDITIDALSSRIDSIDVHDVVEVYFAFTSTEYLTEESVSLTITNSKGMDVSDDFTIQIPEFYARQTSLTSKETSFLIEPDLFCEDDYYRVTFVLSLGSSRATKIYYIQIGDRKPVEILSMESPTYAVGTKDRDTVSAVMLYGPRLSKSDFVVDISGQNGSLSLPQMEIITYENDTLLLAVSLYNVISGEYQGTLSVPSQNISKPFVVTVSDIQEAQIHSVNNITLQAGSVDSTIATVLYGSGLWPSDFHIEVDSVGSDNSFPDWPTAEVSSYDEGVAVIVVDASWADPGVYQAVLSVESSEKSFTIVVEEE